MSNKVSPSNKSTRDGATKELDTGSANSLAVIDAGEAEKATKKKTSSRGSSNASTFEKNIFKRTYTAPLVVVLAVAQNLPLFIALLLTWNFSSRAGEDHVDEFVEHVREVADVIIESKMESVMDSALQKMKSVYGHALETSVSGGSVEAQRTDDETYLEEVKMRSFWTESVAHPFHYEMVHMTHECNGHVVGTGYNHETHVYTAWYTQLDYAHNPHTSTNGVVYDSDGCNTVDLVGSSTAETTYRTTFTEKDGWVAIETPGFTDHGIKTYADGRTDPNYIATKKAEEHCAWSKVFVGLEEPYHLSKTVANSIFDVHGDFRGTVSTTILLDEMVVMIEEISSTVDTLSIIIVDGYDDKVIAASEGNNAHPITSSCTGEKEVELYTMVEYADVVKKESGNRYNYLLQYLDEHAEFYEEMDDHLADISDEDTNHYHSTHGVFVTSKGERMLLAGIHVVDKCALDYTVYIILQEETMVADIILQNNLAHEENKDKTTRTLIGVFGACIFCSILAFFLARAISAPLLSIRKDINLATQLDFSAPPPRFRPFVSELKTMMDQYMKLKITLCDFNRFVPPHLVEELVELEDEAIERTAAPKDIAVLFVYVSNFSAASHNSEINIIADFANQFIGGAADLVSNMSGTVVDFFGESIFGIFNAPYDDPQYVKNAMECAHEIRCLFTKIKADFMSNNPDFSLIDVRIGLHCGSALVGKIGSQSRLKYCAVGDTVNLGSRIENMNRRYLSSMTCSSDFLEALGDQCDSYCTRPMEYVKVQGRSDPVLLYEVGGMINSVENAMLAEFKQHTDLFFAVRAGKAGSEDVEKHIHKYGGSSTFLRSAHVDLAELKEIKKQE